MKSRMDKYKTNDTNERLERTSRYEKLYNKSVDIDVDYIDINKDNVLELDGKKEIKTRESYRKYKMLDSVIYDEVPDRYETQEENKEEPNKVYDINKILEEARKNREKELLEEKKRTINEDYNILTKIDIHNIDKEKEEIEKENLRKIIDTIYSNSLTKEVKKKQVEDQTLMHDLIDEEKNPTIDGKDVSVSICKNMLETDSKEEKVDEEIATLIQNTFIKDESTTEEIEKDFTTIEKTNKAPIIIIVIILLIVLVIGGLILLKYFGTI